jgi:hypothetical protein
MTRRLVIEREAESELKEAVRYEEAAIGLGARASGPACKKTVVTRPAPRVSFPA